MSGGVHGAHSSPTPSISITYMLIKGHLILQKGYQRHSDEVHCCFQAEVEA